MASATLRYLLLGSQGCGLRCLGDVITDDELLGNRAFDQPLDIFQLFHFLQAYQRDRLAATAGASGATDTVDIILCNIRQFVIDDMG